MKRVLCIFFRKTTGLKNPTPGSTSSLQKLLRWLYSFSPIVALDSPNNNSHKTSDYILSLYKGIHLDLSGTERLHKDTSSLFSSLEDGLLEYGISASFALAPTLGSAWALSRFSREKHLCVNYQSLQQHLAPLPLQGLRISSSLVEDLQQLNIQRIGELLALPYPMLKKRFSLELVIRIEQMLGKRAEPINGIIFSPSLKESCFFNSAVEDKAIIELAIKDLLEKLVNTLERSHKKASRLVLSLQGERDENQKVVISISFPSSNFLHLFKVISQRLEALVIKTKVRAMTLEITKSRYTYAAYLESDNKEKKTFSAESLGSLIDNLSEGDEKTSLLSLKTTESYIPENGFAFSQAQAESSATKESSLVITSHRPSVLFYTPQPIKAIAALPDSPPTWLKWKQKSLAIRYGYGPERIFAEWWAQHEKKFSARDYFKVQTADGTWLWLFRELDSSRWFLHGIWA